MKKTGRISWLGLLKFFASLMIIWCHTSLIRDGEQYNLKYTYLFVEFFLIISGYFIYKHFQRSTAKQKTTDESAKEALKYTFSRFVGYIPYVVVCVVAITLLEIIKSRPSDIGGLMSLLKITPFEMIFLSSQTGLRLAPLWYLSALFIVMPLFAFLAQKMPRNLNYLLSLLFIIVIYGNYFNNLDQPRGVDSLIRVFTALCVGTCVYWAAEIISRFKLSDYRKIVLTILEIVSFLIAIALMWPASVEFVQAKPTEFLVIFLFSVSLTLLLSGNTYTSGISIGFFNLLEKLSMPIYLTHWVVIEFIQYYLMELSENKRILILYLTTLACSISLYAIIELYSIKKQQRLKRQTEK